MIIEQNIFEIVSERDFEQCAMKIFRFQAEHCLPYNRYLSLIGCDWQGVGGIDEIPFLPIELYKTEKIYCANKPEQALFLSSGTTSALQSRHFVADLKLYETSFTKGFEQFYAAVENCNIYTLLPNYAENKNSSLLYMVNSMLEKCADGESFLHNHDDLIEKLKGRDRSRHTLLFGVSFALLDLAESCGIDLSENVTIMETGGMKGRRKEMTRNELHQILCRSFGVDMIHSEYGMCECLSQSYSIGDGVFCSPPWMRIVARDLHNPFRKNPHNVRGGINIIDLANIYSCSFIQTQDVGVTLSKNRFAIEGRIDNADIRGCNLMV